MALSAVALVAVVVSLTVDVPFFPSRSETNMIKIRGLNLFTYVQISPRSSLLELGRN